MKRRYASKTYSEEKRRKVDISMSCMCLLACRFVRDRHHTEDTMTVIATTARTATTATTSTSRWWCAVCVAVFMVVVVLASTVVALVLIWATVVVAVVGLVVIVFDPVVAVAMIKVVVVVFVAAFVVGVLVVAGVNAPVEEEGVEEGLVVVVGEEGAELLGKAAGVVSSVSVDGE